MSECCVCVCVCVRACVRACVCVLSSVMLQTRLPAHTHKTPHIIFCSKIIKPIKADFAL